MYFISQSECFCFTSRCGSKYHCQGSYESITLLLQRLVVQLNHNNFGSLYLHIQDLDNHQRTKLSRSTHISKDMFYVLTIRESKNSILAPAVFMTENIARIHL